MATHKANASAGLNRSRGKKSQGLLEGTVVGILRGVYSVVDQG